ncbi:hypothetical protein KUTeg_009409 [Tegillarca granosa]|uniref:C1q domain-containing protein n=1 Tax=Tegillarca granosa TaxID=220873 RepID=A0ABQ9F3S4_TEGGR|nr:hypothetical protein KUTeg_009409 [Tegillarca granosa]
MAITVLIGNNFVESHNADPIATMAREIDTMTLSERLSNIETGYGQRLAGLEAKIDLILADRINSNKALDMVTDVMKLIIQIQKQNNELRTALQVLQNRVQSENIHYDTVASVLNSKVDIINSTLQNQIEVVNLDLHTSLQNKIDIFNTTVQNEISTINTNFQNEFGNIDSTLHYEIDIINTTLKNKIDIVKKEIGNINTTLQNESSKPVAFSTTLSNKIDVFIVNYKIIFDNVIINIGDGYNSSTGVFKVPYQGLYVFHFTIRSEFYFVGDLVVNGVIKRHNYADSRGRSSFRYNSASSMVILYLNENDKVWIQTSVPGKNLYRYNYPGFSGFKIA